MALYNANLMIRELRKAQGLTQEQLAEGICSRETIVKLEKGERKPNWFTFQEIMRRLGLDPEIYNNDMVSQKDIEMHQRFYKCNHHIDMREFQEAKTEIEKMENEKTSYKGSMWNSDFGHEIILRLKSCLHAIGPLVTAFPNPYTDPPLSIKCALECLKITRPDFEIDKIPEYYLATHEFQLLNSLAFAYGEQDGIFKTINLWRKLKCNIEKCYTVTTNNVQNIWYRNMLCNITIILYRAGFYEECLESAEQGLSIVKSTRDMLHFQNYLLAKASCLLRLGHTDEGEELYKKYLLFRYATGEAPDTAFNLSKKDYEKQFGGQLYLFVRW